MPHGTRTAIMLALATSAVAAPIPALGQAADRPGDTNPFGSGSQGASNPASGLVRPDSRGASDSIFGWNPSNSLVRPEGIRPQYSPEAHRSPPSPAPRAAVPAPRAKASSPSGIMTEQQARDRIASAGFTNVRPLRPTYSGSWTGSASNRGSLVRVTVDAQGNISTD